MRVIDYIESEILEFKREIPKKKENLAKEIIAFANSKGGRLIIGYDSQSKEVIGIRDLQKTEEIIANITRDLISSQVDYYVSFQNISLRNEANKVLLIITIDSGFSKPYYLSNKGMTDGTYIRVGSTTRLADQESLARLIRLGRGISFDTEVVKSKEEINKQAIEEFLKERSKRFNSEIPKLTSSLLEDLALVKNKDLTVSGALLFTERPQEINKLSQAYIRAARFAGTTKGEFIDQKEFLGSIQEQLSQALTFIKRHTSTSSKIKGLKRSDKGQYPVEIVREVLVNALAHRDYSISGSTIKLAIFDDRIEVSSPGGLAGPVTVENIQDRQYSRNPILSKRLFEMGYLESWGLGIDKIILWAEDNNLKPPKFIDDGNQFTLILFSEKSSTSISELEKKVLSLFEKQNSITNKTLREELGLSKTQAQIALAKLKEKKIIISQGKGRSVAYHKTRN